MKVFIFRATSILVLCFLVIFWGCGSSENDMETAGDDGSVEIKTSSKETVDEIKNDLSNRKNDQSADNEKPDTRIQDNKFSEKTPKTYAIQLGAFNAEDNAQAFMEKAKQILKTQNIYYKNVDGVFKIRAGNFNSLDETLTMLNKINNDGFTDIFITDLSSDRK
jgi:cell division septation protein DedD